MTFADVAASLILLVNAFDANDSEQVGKVAAVFKSQLVQRPCKANVTRLRACVQVQLDEQEVVTMTDVWTSFTDWLQTDMELVAWLPFVAEHVPAVDAKFTKQVSTGGGVGRTGQSSYQPPRYTVKFESFDGKQGCCALWWRNVELTMDSMKIPMNERYIIFQSLLKGSAKVEHALHLDQLRRDDALSTNDVKLFVDRLVKKFDAGQHEALLKQLNWVKQTRSDVDYFAFEARFLQIVDGLRAYEYRYSDEQLVMMVKSKMIGWDRVAPFDPTTLDEIGDAVRKLGRIDPYTQIVLISVHISSVVLFNSYRFTNVISFRDKCSNLTLTLTPRRSRQSTRSIIFSFSLLLDSILAQVMNALTKVFFLSSTMLKRKQEQIGKMDTYSSQRHQPYAEMFFCVINTDGDIDIGGVTIDALAWFSWWE